MYFFSFVGLLLIVFFIDNGDDNHENNILDGEGILAVIIALSLSFGFLLLVCLLGYALVKIPLSLWQESNYQEKNNRLVFNVAVLEDQIIEQQNEVSKLVNISNIMTVEPDIELYKRILINEIE
jgi:hypothetical protein